MTGYRLYIRFLHALTARHWRGYAVHSPMMYHFIRKIVMPNKRKNLIDAIREAYGSDHVAVVDDVSALQIVTASVAVLRNPFRDTAQRKAFEVWYGRLHGVVAAQLQGMIVLFFDPKLPKQYFKVRN